MTKLCALAVGLGALNASTALATITVTLNDTTYNDTSGGGGEFSAVSAFNFKQFYDPKAIVGGGFETFCIEFNEHMNYGVTYYAVINTAAVNGGVTGGPLDPLSKGTAWLYSQFAAGTLAGYNYNTTLAARQLSSQYLQEAIWYLEGEVTSYTAANPFLVNSGTGVIVSKFGSIAAAAVNAGILPNGAVEYNVVALNLYTTLNANGTYSGNVQDQLAIIPEPATMIVGALLLLPFGAGALRSLRKNRAHSN